MTINGTDISTYGARQHHVEFGYHQIKNDSAWIRSAILPHFAKNYIDFKQISVDVMVKPKANQSAMHPRDAIHRNVSDLLAALLEPADLVLDNFSHTFKVILKSHKENEESMRRFHKITLDFIGYEYGAEVTASGTGSVTITNPGNILSPVLLTLTPAANASNVRITGVCPDPHTGADQAIILGTVTKNKVITLDGANGLFTEGNTSTLKPDITILSPPGIVGGQKTITCSASTMRMTAKVLPLYM